ncbi:unnamed protein product [Arctogadus glacialis]
MASEAWTAAKVLHTPSYMPFLAGTLGIAIRRGEITGLREFLLRICPDNDTLSSQDNNNLVRVSVRNTFQYICDFNATYISYVSSFFMNPCSLGEAILGAHIPV